MSLKPKVALAQDFLSVLAKLPNAIQGKILKWAIKFQSDPTSSGINYENIYAARDANLKSVRIDQDVRRLEVCREIEILSETKFDGIDTHVDKNITPLCGADSGDAVDTVQNRRSSQSKMT